MDADNNVFLFPNTPGGRDALRCELVRRKGTIADCPVSAVNWDGVAVFRRRASLGADASTKIPIKAIWRMDAKDREAVARNTQRYASERTIPWQN